MSQPYPIELGAMRIPGGGDKFDYCDPKTITKFEFSSKSITNHEKMDSPWLAPKLAPEMPVKGMSLM